jgi:proteic killer suppression protein
LYSLCSHRPSKGNREFFLTVAVQANWPVIFKFEDGDVYVVDYLDYH